MVLPSLRAISGAQGLEEGEGEGKKTEIPSLRACSQARSHHRILLTDFYSFITVSKKIGI